MPSLFDAPASHRNAPSSLHGGSYLGIDPGASGGLAVIAADTITVEKMPATDRELWDWFRWFDPKQKPFAVVEQVGGYIQGNAAPGSAMFNFGVGYGKLLAFLTAAGIPFETVTPQRWQKGLGIPGRKRDESKTAWKRRLLQHCQRLHPAVRLTLATCDALLLATYAQRKQTGTL